MSNKAHLLNRGLMWGQLLLGLESAKQQIDLAQRGDGLLSEDDRLMLSTIKQTLIGIEQRAWVAQNKEAKAKK